MSSPYSFQPKTRREAREAEQKQPTKKQKTPKKSSGKILGIFKTEKSFTITAVTLSVAVVGVSVFSAWQSGLFDSEPEFVLAGPETFNESASQSLDELLVYNPETGELEARKLSEMPQTNNDPDSPFGQEGAEQFEIPTFSPDDFVTDINYEAEIDEDLTNFVSVSNSYRLLNTGSPQFLLRKVASVFNVQGTIKTRQDSFNPTVWLTSGTDFEEPYIRFYHFTSEIPRPYSTSSITYWEYSAGRPDCSNVSISTNLNQQQYNGLNNLNKTCYDDLVLSGRATPIPVTEQLANSETERFLRELGYNPNNFQISLYPSPADGSISTLATFILDEKPTPLEFEFNFINGGRLYYAIGPDFNIDDGRSFNLLSPVEAGKRLNNYLYYGDISSLARQKYQNFTQVVFPLPTGIPQSSTIVTQLNVQYPPGVDPRENDGTIPGFEQVEIVISPTIVEQVQESSNIWRIDLGTRLNDVTARAVAQDVTESPLVIFATPNSYSNVTSPSPQQQAPPVNVSADSQVWLIIIDARGVNHLVKGYTYITRNPNTYYGAVVALEDSVLGIR